MQAKWLLPSWLFEFWPSFLLPSSHGCINANSKNYPNYHLQSSKLSNLVHIFSFRYIPVPKNTDLGGAWTAALQAAIVVLPWLDIGEAHWRKKTFGKKRSHQNSSCHIASHAGVYGSIEVPLSLAYTHIFSLIFGHFFMEANQCCFPAVLALSGVIMPPLEKLPSKLLPSQVDVIEDEASDKEVQEVVVGDVATPQVHTNSSKLKDNLDKVVVEPKTGFQFPTILCSDVFQSQTLGTSMQVLAGVGLRSLTIVKLKSIKIYAFGFYIKPDVLKEQFSEKYGAVTPEELKHNPCFFEDLLRHDLGMTVRLMVHHKGLKMGMVRSAFETSLKNRLKKLKGVEADEGLDIFNSYFSQNLSLPRGTVIDFQWLPGGELRTEIDGKLIGTIHSRDFCRAFFDIYIGDPPVSLKTKEDIGEKLGQILSGSASLPAG